MKITDMIIDYLPTGALPLYDTGDFYPGKPMYVLDILPQRRPLWSIENVSLRGDVLAQERMDTSVSMFTSYIRQWLGMLDDEGDGTLIFSIRTLDQHLDLLVGSLIFIPTPLNEEIYNTVGIPLREGQDPVHLLIQAALNNREDPALQAFLMNRNFRDRRTEKTLNEWRRAEERATRLLNECLTEEQKVELVRDNQFHVRGQDGNLYLIERSSHQNVYRVENSKVVAQFCLILKERTPVQDLMLAQKLLLEANIAEFMRIANKWTVHRNDQGEVLRALIDNVPNEGEILRDLLENVPLQQAV